VQIEWIVGGVILLVAALAAKMMIEQLMLQRLALAFTFVWATLMALHFWEAGVSVFGGIAGILRGTPAEVVSFWIVFILCAAPGVLLLRLWLKTYDAVFPLVLERLSAAVCTLVLVLGVPSLVVMTGMLMPPRISRVLPSSGVAGAVTRTLEHAPIRLYLAIAAPTSPWTGRELTEKRLPDRVRRVILEQR
jgi:hypothetical protein